MTDYAVPPGGLPPQTALTTGRAIFTEAFAVIPRGVLTDIVTSLFPGWSETRGWILARPLSGFAETFCQILMEVAPGGGADVPEPEAAAQGAYFVMDGALTLTLEGEARTLAAGGFAYIPPGTRYSVENAGNTPARFHWIRKRWVDAGLARPDPVFTSDRDVAPTPMPGTDAWATTRFIDPADLRHDMHVNVVSFAPGGAIPFAETHVMEHGLYILEGKGVYRLNDVWVEVEAGDFLWLRAFCPQACYAGGPGPFRYLLYKDVNRLPGLGP
ncbi:MAG: bifunctional allantoicase/(S)-ureidoglycine aminohydrolase [Pseudomonadota bacterium]